MSLGLPPELYTIWEAYPWRFGEPYCLFKTFLTELMSSASVLTILAFTVERYIAICHPLRAQAVSTPARAVKTLIVLWVGAFLSALPYTVHSRTYYYLDDPRHSDVILRPSSYVTPLSPTSLWRQTAGWLAGLQHSAVFDASDEVRRTGVDAVVVRGADVRHDGAVRVDSAGTEAPIDRSWVLHQRRRRRGRRW